MERLTHRRTHASRNRNPWIWAPYEKTYETTNTKPSKTCTNTSNWCVKAERIKTRNKSGSKEMLTVYTMPRASRPHVPSFVHRACRSFETVVPSIHRVIPSESQETSWNSTSTNCGKEPNCPSHPRRIQPKERKGRARNEKQKPKRNPPRRRRPPKTKRKRKRINHKPRN